MLVVHHGDGLRTKYCHVRHFSVNEGETVVKGQQVGEVGGGKNDVGRGNAGGAHLHYSIHTNTTKPTGLNHGNGVDPESGWVDNTDCDTQPIVNKDLKRCVSFSGRHIPRDIFLKTFELGYFMNVDGTIVDDLFELDGGIYRSDPGSPPGETIGMNATTFIDYAKLSNITDNGDPITIDNVWVECKLNDNIVTSMENETLTRDEKIVNAGVKLTGVITDTATGDVIVGVNVKLVDVTYTPADKAEAITDGTGAYDFNLSPNTLYQITASMDGYVSKTITVTTVGVNDDIIRDIDLGVELVKKKEKVVKKKEKVVKKSNDLPKNFALIPGGMNNFRTDQPNEAQFLKIFNDYPEIKTVLQVNGSRAWEKGVIEGAGLKHIKIDPHKGYAYGKGHTTSINKLLSVMNEGGVLIHCTHGADRTGYAVAVHLMDQGIITGKEALWEYTTKYNAWDKSGYICSPHKTKRSGGRLGNWGYIKYMEAFYPLTEWCKVGKTSYAKEKEKWVTRSKCHSCKNVTHLA